MKLDYCFHIFYWFYLLEIGAWISQAVQDDCCALFDHFCGDDDGGKASSFSTARSLIISLMITRPHRHHQDVSRSLLCTAGCPEQFSSLSGFGRIRPAFFGDSPGYCFSWKLTQIPGLLVARERVAFSRGKFDKGGSSTIATTNKATTTQLVEPVQVSLV